MNFTDNMKKFAQTGRVKKLDNTITTPEYAGLRLLVNLCSTTGKFDEKINQMLAKRWGKVREDCRYWFAGRQDFKLGSMTNTLVASDIWVVNLLVKNDKGELDEVALKAAVKKLADFAKYEKGSVHISSVLTDEIPTLEALVVDVVAANGVNVYFYNEPQAK